MKKILTLAFCVLASAAPAAVIQFDLLGRAGPGLIAGNENGTVNGTPGTGGETGAGFSYDDVANIFTLNFAWTGLQGATIGTFGSATGFHIHGPVLGDPFLGNVSVLHNISNNTSAAPTTPSYTISNLVDGTGSVGGTISGLSPAMVSDLLAGRWYVNVHSGVNTGGEIRGNLVAIPEPSSALLGIASLGLVLRRRRS
jgi:hypothetical protein